MIRKRLLSACLALALCLSLLPVTALAADGIELYVGGQLITDSGCYANQDGTWTKVDGTEPASGQFYYDADTVTLTLNQAEISYDRTLALGTKEYYGSVIAYSPSADVSLNIVVSQGTSTITGKGGIRVESTTGNASLSIKGSGSLDVEPKGSNSGITLCSSKNTNLDIDGADVTASSPALYGVYLISSTDASSTSTITVNNGSLTTGGNGNVGIYYYWSGTNNAGTSSLTVSGNAVVDTRNSQIMAQNKETVVQVGAGSDGNGGIVFNGKSGTVYGDVTLDESLIIGSEETLTIPDDSSLNSNGKLTNNGKIIVDNGGKLEGTIEGNQPPKITTERLNDGTVNTKYNQTLVASGDATITWSSSDLPNWLTLNSDGTISGTPTAAGTYSFTVTATNDYGSDSKEFTLTIDQQGTIHVTSVSLDKANLELTEGETAQLTATVLPDNATNKNVTWSTSNASIATVDANGEVTAVSAGTATITATADGKSATCTVTVTADTVPVTGVTMNKTSTSLYVGGSETLTATVQPGNASNQTVTWSTSDPSVATVENGTVTAVGRGTATITVTTVDGGFTADCTVTVSRYSTGGGPTTYAVTAPDAENGTVRVSPSRASRGTTVTITVTPDEGYELESLTVLDSRDNEIPLTDKGDGKYTFTMPAGRVTVEASFAEIAPEPLPFADVDDGDWFADAVRFVYENGMMLGVSETDFAPHSTTSRSMIVTILYRLEGEPVVDYAMDFTDVAEGEWYTEAVRWAASESIVGGYGGGLFGADDAVTREQLAAILYRYAVYKGYDVSIGEDTNILSYADFADLSEYAIPAMQWACGAGIVNGTSESTLTPQGEATRAQVAAMLMRFCESIVQ